MESIKQVINFDLEFKPNHMWIGLYWETWPIYDNLKKLNFNPAPIKKHTDIWLAIPFVALRIIYVR